MTRDEWYVRITSREVYAPVDILKDWANEVNRLETVNARITLKIAEMKDLAKAQEIAIIDLREELDAGI